MGKRDQLLLTALFFIDEKFMPLKEKSAYKKKRGRPPGSRYASNIPCRLAGDTLADLDEFAGSEKVTRSEAVRRLIDFALALKATNQRKFYQYAMRSLNRKNITQEPSHSITIRQVKAARSLLGWSQSDLAGRSAVSEPTIARLESTEGRLGGRRETIRKIRTALEAAGVEFTNGDQPGVRLTKAAAAKPAEHFRKPKRTGTTARGKAVKKA